MLVGQQIVAQRFMGHLKLVITMPVSKAAYVVGTLLYTAVSGTLSALFLLGIRPSSPAWRSRRPGRWPPRCYC